jgi:hypothetical protein
MTTTDMPQLGVDPPCALALLAGGRDPDTCDVCGTGGPLALQEVGGDPDAVFLLCAPCGNPAVEAGLARWTTTPETTEPPS